MIQKGQEICGSFAVVTEKREIKTVVVTQEVLSYYRKEERYSKTFHLESPNGVPVYRTEDPDIFQLIDGSLLKKTYR